MVHPLDGMVKKTILSKTLELNTIASVFIYLPAFSIML